LIKNHSAPALDKNKKATFFTLTLIKYHPALDKKQREWGGKALFSPFCGTLCHLQSVSHLLDQVNIPVTTRGQQAYLHVKLSKIIRHRKTLALDLSGASLPPSNFLDFFWKGISKICQFHFLDPRVLVIPTISFP